jgi:hypothetical protein
MKDEVTFRLPPRVRLRLRAVKYIDSLCVWLILHDHRGIALRIWSACGLLGRKQHGHGK